MNIKSVRLTSAALSAAVLASAVGVPALAAENQSEKSETVYILTDGNGNANSVIVSDWLKNLTGASTLEDSSTLTDIQVVKGDAVQNGSGDSLSWTANGEDVYYQGTSTEELPVGVTITYELDGKEISPDQLAGQSGHLVIRIQYTNNAKRTVTVDGKKLDMYVPFMMATGMVLDNEVCKNVTVDHGKVENDGDRTVILGYGFPGLADSLDLKGEEKSDVDTDDGSDLDIDLPDISDSVTVEMDVTDFAMTISGTMATASLLDDLDLENDSTLDDIEDKLDELTDAADELADGTKDLLDGVDELLDGSNELKDGAHQLADGSADLEDGAEQLVSGTSSVSDGANSLVAGLGSLSTGIASAYQGAAQLEGGLKQLHTGADSLVAGIAQVSAGASQLSSALSQSSEQLSSGAAELSEGAAALSTALTQAQTNSAALLGGVQTALTDSANAEYQALQVFLAMPTEEQAQYADVIAALQASLQEKQGISLDGFSSLTSGLSQAIEGATTVATGAQTLQAGVASAATGASQLTAGIAQVSSGASSLRDGIVSAETGATQLTAGLASAKSGAEQLVSGGKQLQAGTTTLFDGTKTLYEGTSTLRSGADDLADGTDSLVEGIQTLRDGASDLNDGMNEFREDGIEKLVNLYQDNVPELVHRLQALQELGQEYNSFSGIETGTDGEVTFLFRSDSIG